MDLELAVEFGARIHKIYEIWDWGRKDLTQEMFAGMVNVRRRGGIWAEDGSEGVCVC